MADRNIEANPLSSLFIKTRPLQMNTAVAVIYRGQSAADYATKVMVLRVARHTHNSQLTEPVS
jgi:hypothetical protein